MFSHSLDVLSTCQAGYTLFAKYHEMLAKYEKLKVYIGVFRSTFLTFYTILRKGPHCRETSVRFHSLLFRGHEIQMKYEKCIVVVLYFVLRFAITLAK